MEDALKSLSPTQFPQPVEPWHPDVTGKKTEVSPFGHDHSSQSTSRNLYARCWHVRYSMIMTSLGFATIGLSSLPTPHLSLYRASLAVRLGRTIPFACCFSQADMISPYVEQLSHWPLTRLKENKGYHLALHIGSDSRVWDRHQLVHIRMALTGAAVRIQVILSLLQKAHCEDPIQPAERQTSERG
ncbi:hypothetical protein K443DRAFT_681367 [Laccaria amethystina LaAM-08-1]|jgi:hypothetical protein|uniref:Uncharacterized protein n=1 Tax=Laccaria amethystina LaAM-08-1 TaxID=1095629 RepID=A0A0C9XNS3_9AGAR|nr:hypothetical protein K443DRAFT_681367 [Laccaria amethystina LaAM-08-1]